MDSECVHDALRREFHASILNLVEAIEEAIEEAQVRAVDNLVPDMAALLWIAPISCPTCRRQPAQSIKSHLLMPLLRPALYTARHMTLGQCLCLLERNWLGETLN